MKRYHLMSLALIGSSMMALSSLPTASVYASDTLVEAHIPETLSGASERTRQTLHNYGFQAEHPIQTQISWRDHGNQGLVNFVKEAYDYLWHVLCGTQNVLEGQSNLQEFANTFEEAFVKGADAVLAIDPVMKDLQKSGLPGLDQALSWAENVKKSDAEALGETAHALVTFINQKLAQQEIEPNDVSKDFLSASTVFETDTSSNVQKDLSNEQIRKLSFNMFYTLMVKNALQGVLLKEHEGEIKKANEILNIIRAAKIEIKRFNAADNTTEEQAKHEETIAVHKDKVTQLITQRKSTQEKLRQKMLEILNILHAPQDDGFVMDVTKRIHQVFPVGQSTEVQKGWFESVGLTKYGIWGTASYQCGGMHPRAVMASQVIHPLLGSEQVEAAYNLFVQTFIMHSDVKNSDTLHSIVFGKSLPDQFVPHKDAPESAWAMNAPRAPVTVNEVLESKKNPTPAEAARNARKGKKARKKGR